MLGTERRLTLFHSPAAQRYHVRHEPRPVTLRPRVRQALLTIVGLLLLWLAWTGVAQGVKQLPQSETVGQVTQSVSQLSFGLFALLSLVTTFWGRRWNTMALGGWTISVALAAGFAAVVWGGTSLAKGLLTGAAALLVGLVIAWLLRVGARGLRGMTVDRDSIRSSKPS